MRLKRRRFKNMGSPVESGLHEALYVVSRYVESSKNREAAYAVRMYLDPPPNYLFDPPFPTTNPNRPILTMIELGSGSGLVGSTVASFLTEDDMLVLTDLSEVCPLLETNVKTTTNNAKTVHVQPLAWGNAEDANAIARELLRDRILTHILCSDLVYFPELLAPLLRTLIQLSSASFSSAADNPITIIISYKVRSLPKETPFWSAFGLWFTYEPLLEQVVLPDGARASWRRFGSDLDDPIFIFVAQRRPESLDWTVPADDHDLLAGVGAGGTLQPKESDYFENLLFMTLHDQESDAQEVRSSE
ncbi:hypothetical protein V5O48_002425 [Marasmius crinis-equi]|uniref:Methyltransferase-domain-containing protein n=1 Tax=Marasmius crinis-equi TaxID=585013 RepID=A0ABR3FWG0_9AGAR